MKNILSSVLLQAVIPNATDRRMRLSLGEYVFMGKLGFLTGLIPRKSVEQIIFKIV